MEGAGGPAPGAPWWAVVVTGAILTLIPAGYGLARLWFWWKNRRNQAAQAEQAAHDARIELIKQAALKQASAVIEQLSKKVEAHDAELEKIRLDSEEKEKQANKRTADCEAEHARTRATAAGTRATLKMVVVWAKRRGLPMTRELEELINEDSSAQHPPISRGDKS